MAIEFIEDQADVIYPLLVQLTEAFPTQWAKRRTGGKVNNQQVTGYQMLAIQVAEDLRRQYRDEQDPSKPNYRTIIKTLLPGLKKAVRSRAQSYDGDPALKSAVAGVAEHFCNELRLQFSAVNSEQSAQYKDQVRAHALSTDKPKYDLGPMLAQAHDSLTKAAAGKPVDYRDVSLAVALTSGRRMAEIHYSGVFEPVGDYLLNFSGQLKGRGEEAEKTLNEVRQIPTLLKAELVAAGVAWLAAHGKRIKPTGQHTADAKRVNANYSRYLSEAVKKLDSALTYKDLRALYLSASIRNAFADKELDLEEIQSYGGKILGHSKDDTATVDSYKKFGLKSGSITRV